VRGKAVASLQGRRAGRLAGIAEPALALVFHVTSPSCRRRRASRAPLHAARGSMPELRPPRVPRVDHRGALGDDERHRDGPAAAGVVLRACSRTLPASDRGDASSCSFMFPREPLAVRYVAMTLHTTASDAPQLRASSKRNSRRCFPPCAADPASRSRANLHLYLSANCLGVVPVALRKTRVDGAGSRRRCARAARAGFSPGCATSQSARGARRGAGACVSRYTLRCS